MVTDKMFIMRILDNKIHLYYILTAMKIRKILFCFAVLLFTLNLGCPYSFSNQLPNHLKTVAVPLLEDKTFEFGLKERFTNSIIDQFMQSNVLKVTDLQHADSVFKGVIKSYKKQASSYDSDEKVKAYEIVIKIEIEFKDLKKDKIIYKNSNYTARAQYNIGGSEEEAKNVLVSDTAKKLVQEALTTW